MFDYLDRQCEDIFSNSISCCWFSCCHCYLSWSCVPQPDTGVMEAVFSEFAFECWFYSVFPWTSDICFGTFHPLEYVFQAIIFNIKGFPYFYQTNFCTHLIQGKPSQLFKHALDWSMLISSGVTEQSKDIIVCDCSLLMFSIKNH